MMAVQKRRTQAELDAMGMDNMGLDDLVARVLRFSEQRDSYEYR